MRILPCLLAIAMLPVHAAEPVKLESPDQRWSATIATDPQLEITLNDAAGNLLINQTIGMKLESGSIPAEPFAEATTRAVRETITAPVRQKAAKLDDHFNEATLKFEDGTQLIVRLYNEGLAYRFATDIDHDITVLSEERVCRFAGDPTVFFSAEEDFYSHNEVTYEVGKLSQFAKGRLASLPLTIKLADDCGILVLSESALESYPGEWMRVGGNSLDGTNPGYPARIEHLSDRDAKPVEREDFIAKTSGKRAFPWRTVAAAKSDAELLTNMLNFVVADPPRISDTTWIKPGKVAWDWWHDWTWNGEKLPINNDTYKRYIDFASKHGIPYVILDEGWYELGDLTKQRPGIDVPALVEYGRERNVGIILWATSATLEQQFDEVMPLFEKWGIAGLKVDFFQRDDQPEIELYWKIAKDAADRKLLLDFHGAHKPAGLQRTYPNVLTFEGIKGLEQSKWSPFITPTHDVLLPYTRFVAGPADYTPGAMTNVQPAKFKGNNSAPMSQGTRCHELAKYVVFDSPLQMLCDAPPHYEADPEALEFLKAVPATWDETHALGGLIGEFAALARRSGDAWFLGAMTNEEGRELELDLSLLGEGGYELTIWQDGDNADVDAESFERKALTVKGGEKLPIKLAPSGGWVAIATPIRE